jgi:hypothetical protein
MIESVRSPFAFALSVVSGIAVADAVGAQTCANPGYVVVNQTVSGNTCTNNMPTQNHGTILTPGGDAVFFAGGGPYGVSSLRVDAAAQEDVFVFVCSGCGPNEECVAVAENGVNNGYVDYPQDGRQYYVIVDGLNTCTDFQLSAIGPLKQNP